MTDKYNNLLARLKGYKLLVGGFQPATDSSADAARRMRVTHQVALLALLITTLYVLLYLGFELWSVAIYGVFTGLVYMVVPWLVTKGMTRFAPLYLINAACFNLTTIPLLFTGPETGIHYFLFFTGPFSYLTFDKRDRFWSYPYALVGVLCFLLVDWQLLQSPWLLDMPPILLNILFVNSVGFAALVLTAIVVIFSKELDKAQQQAANEYARSEALLLNILPSSIAERLKKEHKSIAQTVDSASVLFADIIGFTELSSKIPASELLSKLNQYFSAFDDLVEQYGAEKIKTIGDCYMAAAGVPDACDNHAYVLVGLAFDMLAVTEEINRDSKYPLQLRLGVHTGPLAAGVIGKRKFVYDLWGDTVNIAQRMESLSQPGRIQVSNHTYHLIADEYDAVPRGDIAVKGKGRLRCWLLLNRGSEGSGRLGAIDGHS